MKSGSNTGMVGGHHVGRYIQWIFNVVVLVALALSVALNCSLYRAIESLSLEDIEGVSYFEEQENLFDPEGCEDFFYDYDGSVIEAQNGSVMSNWIPCSAGQQITRNGIATNVVCYFDADKNFLQRVDSYGLATITVPDDDAIAYVRMAVQVADSRMIVYGDQISDTAAGGDYYTIDELMISDRNLEQDPTIIESPDGTQWRIAVADDGSISAVDVTGTLSASELPEDFPQYTITGSSISDEDFLVSMRGTTDAGYNYIFVMTPQGDIRWYKQVPGYAYNFRKIVYDDGTIRYAYQQYDSDVENINGGITFTHIVLMDESFNVINDNIHPLAYGSITESDYGCENHDYKILADDHYILTTVTLSMAENVPGYEGKQIPVVNAIVQEQKAGEVLMQWEAIDHPELYTASVYNNDFGALVDDPDAQYTDYVHINSVAVDPESYDLLISCRSIGLIKLDRENGDILWMMGRGRNDIAGLADEQIGLYQHDVRYLEDGSITIFDNSGGVDSTSRVCRYWIDEENKKLESFEEFTTEYKSTSMGCAGLVDDQTDTYLICYGGGIADFAFEERDFSTGQVNMQLEFDNGDTLYRIFRGTEYTPVGE